jgi:hypothetical protein
VWRDSHGLADHGRGAPAGGGLPNLRHDRVAPPTTRRRLRSNERAADSLLRLENRVFGACKRRYGVRRMRRLGQAQGRPTAIASNVRRSWRLLKPKFA